MEHELEVARGAAKAAGEVLLRYYGSAYRVSEKSADNPVTVADLESNEVLKSTILAAFPNDGWLSEETADSPERLKRERLWVVDPIDGTNSFVAGRPEFAVCVGLVDGGRAVVGVVHNPVTGEVFSAVEGGGAFCDGEPIRVSTVDADGGPRIVASRWEMKRGELDAFHGAWSVEPLGSTAYKMCRVAEGGAEAFVSRGPKIGRAHV